MANFSSLMGYQYHQKRCGKQLTEADKPVFSCPHCGKKYKSKAGHDYHVRSEHTASVSPPDASAARGVGPSPPGGDCRAAEPVGRTEPGRAGPGKAGADVGPILFSPSHHHARVLYQAVSGYSPLCPSEKAGCCIYGSGAVGSIPLAWCPRGCAPAHPASMLCREKKQSSGRSLGSKQAPAACQRWGGRIRPWGASFSVLLIPTDSASDANNSLTLINGDVYTRGSAKGRNQSNAWLSAGLREAGVLPLFPCSGAEARQCLCSPRLHKAVCKRTDQTPASPSRSWTACCFTSRHALPDSVSVAASRGARGEARAQPHRRF